MCRGRGSGETCRGRVPDALIGGVVQEGPVGKMVQDSFSDFTELPLLSCFI